MAGTDATHPLADRIVLHANAATFCPPPASFWCTEAGCPPPQPQPCRWRATARAPAHPLSTHTCMQTCNPNHLVPEGAVHQLSLAWKAPTGDAPGQAVGHAQDPAHVRGVPKVEQAARLHARLLLALLRLPRAAAQEDLPEWPDGHDLQQATALLPCGQSSSCPSAYDAAAAHPSPHQGLHQRQLKPVHARLPGERFPEGLAPRLQLVLCAHMSWHSGLFEDEY